MGPQCAVEAVEPSTDSGCPGLATKDIDPYPVVAVVLWKEGGPVRVTSPENVQPVKARNIGILRIARPIR